MAIAEIARVLAPGGRVLITVPAFQSLWGLQDRQAMHKRRYRINQLLPVLESANLMPARFYYFNYLLFIPIYLSRRVIDFLKIDLKSEGQVNTPLINRVLLAIFRLDVRSAAVIKPPFGVSILVMAAKQRGAT